MTKEDLLDLLDKVELTKDDLKRIMLKHFVKEYEKEFKKDKGECYLDLGYLDFSCFDGDVYIGCMKVKKNLFQEEQFVNGDLFQNYQEVAGNLFQDKQDVQGDLWQDCQNVSGDLFQDKQEVDGKIYQDELEEDEE